MVLMETFITRQSPVARRIDNEHSTVRVSSPYSFMTSSRISSRIPALVLGVVLTFFLPLATAQSQAVRKATPADSDATAATMLTRSFQGIPQSSAERKLAFAIFKREFLTANRLIEEGGDFDKLDSLADRREASLLALLHTKADTARFLKNSDSYRSPRARGR